VLVGEQLRIFKSAAVQRRLSLSAQVLSDWME